jgi:hypothetical protein
MRRLPTLLSVIVLLQLTVTVDGADKQTARLERISRLSAETIRLRPSLASADTCIVRHDSGMVWKIDGWVVGNELYKSYMDPAQNCATPYPFTVTEIVMAMYFGNATLVYASVDIEDVDNTVPGCPSPGVLLAISSEYEIQVPGPGLYEIWIPLDTPYVVNGPFFAGFFIGNVIDPADSPAVIIDDIPVECVSYNIWNDSIGFIDLVNNQFWNFPGRLVLYAAGFPGGQSGGAPALTLLSPADNDTLYSSCDLWAWETTGSNIIDYVSFAYSTGGPYVEISRDYDGLQAFRNGVNGSGGGDGFRVFWDFSGLAEGTYTLRATVYDTLGQSAADSVTVFLEPTPPQPNITSPAGGVDFCTTLNMLMTCPDENLSYIEVHRQPASLNYSAGMSTLQQSLLGDVNGNPADGNHASGGEYGDYYCGPVAAALAVKLWYDRGYVELMREGANIISLDTLAERLAALFQTRQNLGTYDEALVHGLKQYTAARGDYILYDHRRNPDYFTLRTWVEDEQRAVLLGLGGTPGIWLAVDGFSGWEQSDGSYLVRVSDPVTGTLVDVAMRNNFGTNEILYNGNWQRVDLMVSLLAKTWNVSRTLIGADLNGNDGWTFTWTPSGITEDSIYFFRATGHDDAGLSGSQAVLLKYTCSQTYTVGDYNGDGFADIRDLNYLISYLALDGPPPVGGPIRADCNCDAYINIADIVYYMNYLFGNVSSPCY